MPYRAAASIDEQRRVCVCLAQVLLLLLRVDQTGCLRLVAMAQMKAANSRAMATLTTLAGLPARVMRR